MREVETVARRRAFGSQLATARRKAIEDRAVKAATAHFETAGWFVDDVGLYEPYDLHCSKGRRNLHIEVKGSTGLLRSTALTAGEVEDAPTPSRYGPIRAPQHQARRQPARRRFAARPAPPSARTRTDRT